MSSTPTPNTTAPGQTAPAQAPPQAPTGQVAQAVQNVKDKLGVPVAKTFEISWPTDAGPDYLTDETLAKLIKAASPGVDVKVVKK